MINTLRNVIRETIRQIGPDTWAVYPKKGGKRLGTHHSRASAARQLAAIEISKARRGKNRRKGE